MYAVIGNGWFLTFRSERAADRQCLKMRRLLGWLFYVEEI
jgi:hypothetical protein